MTAYSLLDLVPVVEGGSVAHALANAADMARHAEASGYGRYWVAEHHGMAGIASAATAVVIVHVAAATRSDPCRCGRDHAAQPRAARHRRAIRHARRAVSRPDRSRAWPGAGLGSDRRARALRRTLASDPNAFPQDVLELQSYFADDGRTGIRATPGAGAKPEMWILGSSLFGAQLAAALGLPFAFASHFAPDALDQAIAVYRARFSAVGHLGEAPCDGRV